MIDKEFQDWYRKEYGESRSGCLDMRKSTYKFGVKCFGAGSNGMKEKVMNKLIGLRPIRKCWSISEILDIVEGVE